MKPFLKYLPSALLILLFVYAAATKLTGFDEFRIQLYHQTIPREVASVLLYVIPAAELIAAGLLMFSCTELKGLLLSLSLLSIFSIYIFLVIIHFWSRVPCPCGGILGHMTWPAHLGFNILFIAVNLIAISIQLKERRSRTSQ